MKQYFFVIKSEIFLAAVTYLATSEIDFTSGKQVAS